MSDNTMSSEAYMETETWQACTEEALRAEIRTLETELRDTGKILERLDKAGSWGVMVSAAELQRMEAELAAARERVAKLEAVKDAAKVVDGWHKQDIHTGNAVQYVRVIHALSVALREAGEV